MWARPDQDADREREPQSDSRSERRTERPDPGFSRLPGVVNDLPEVAPHEWIYIMS